MPTSPDGIPAPGRGDVLGYDPSTGDRGTDVDEAGRAGPPERLLGALLLFGVAWLAVGLLVWIVRLLGGFGWVPWVPLTVLALAVPYVQTRAAVLLLRPGPARGDGAGGDGAGGDGAGGDGAGGDGAGGDGAGEGGEREAADRVDRSRVGTGLGLAAGLGAAVLPLPVTAPALALQPALAQLPTVLTVIGGAAAVAVLALRHGLRPDRLRTPPASLVLSATALAMVWLGLALDQATWLVLVPALPGAIVVALAALTGPAGYRGGLLLGWWWGLVTSGGSLLVAALFLAVVYRQAWAGLVIVGVAVALVAAWVAMRAVPAGA